MEWYMLAIFGMLFLGGCFLLFKVAGNLGANSYAIIFFEFVIASAIILVYSFYAKINIIPTGNAIWYVLIAIGILGAIGNIMVTKSIITAPNPGYALAIINANVLVVTIGAVLLLGSELTVIKLTGIIFILIGVIILGF